jgi:hypothetical protein
MNLRRSLRVVSIPVLLVFPACGAFALAACGSPPPAKEPIVVPSASAAPAPVAKAPPPDLSPVAAPTNVLLRGVWRSPAATQRALETIVGRSLESFVQDKIGDPEVAELLDRASPVHVAVLTTAGPDRPSSGGRFSRRAIDQDNLAAAFSLPLRDFASARSFAERNATIEPVGPGVVRIRRTEHGDEDLACALSIAAGAAPARLVCAEGAEALTAVLPWMTRTLPTEVSGTGDEDWSFVGSGPVLQAFVEPRLDEALPRPDSGDVSAATTRLRDTLRLFLKDAKQAEFRAKIDPRDTHMSLALEVSGKSSPLTRLMFSGSPTGAPPELRRAPEAVTNIGFSGGLDAEIGRKLMMDLLLHDVARHASHGHGQPYGAQATMEKLIERFPAFAPFWFVRGVAPRETVPRDEKWMARRLREERALVGWVGFGVSMPPSELFGYFSDVLKSANPQHKSSSGKSTALGRTGAPPAGFPAGSKAIYLTSEHTDWSAGQRPGKVVPVLNQTITVVFSPLGSAGDKTLVVLGVDKNDLAAHAKELLQDGTPDEAQRARAAQIEADFQGSVGAMAVIPSVIGDAIASSMRTTNPLRGVPNGGKTPVSMVIRPTKGGAELTAEIRVHEPSMADAGAAARFGLDILSMSGVMRRDRGLPLAAAGGLASGEALQRQREDARSACLSCVGRGEPWKTRRPTPRLRDRTPRRPWLTRVDGLRVSGRTRPSQRGDLSPPRGRAAGCIDATGGRSLPDDREPLPSAAPATNARVASVSGPG